MTEAVDTSNARPLSHDEALAQSGADTGKTASDEPQSAAEAPVAPFRVGNVVSMKGQGSDILMTVEGAFLHPMDHQWIIGLVWFDSDGHLQRAQCGADMLLLEYED